MRSNSADAAPGSEAPLSCSSAKPVGAGDLPRARWRGRTAKRCLGATTPETPAHHSLLVRSTEPAAAPLLGDSKKNIDPAKLMDEHALVQAALESRLSQLQV